MKKMENRELLQYALEHGMINMSCIEEQIEMNKRRELLKNHPYSVWQGKDGNWYTHFLDDDGNRVMRKRKNRSDIEDLICDYWREKEENPTISEIFEEWIRKKAEYKEIQEASVVRYTNDFKRFFTESGFDKKHIKKIQEDDIEDFIRTEIAKRNLTAKSYSGLRILVKGIFQYAKKRKMTSISISEFFGDLDISRNTFRKSIKEKEDEVFSEDEVPKLVAYLNSNPDIWNLGLLLTLQTGLRVGELSTLEPEDWNGDILKVRRHESRSKDNKIRVIEFAKTDSGVRDIILTDRGKSTIQKIININPNGKYLFENSSGKRIRGNTFNKRLDTVLNKLNMHHRSIHKLRKTYCTMLIDAGCEDAVIMNQLGHASIETSRKYYYFCNRTKQHQADQVRNAITV